jgi:hypothetical protein
VETQKKALCNALQGTGKPLLPFTGSGFKLVKLCVPLQFLCPTCVPPQGLSPLTGNPPQPARVTKKELLVTIEDSMCTYQTIEEDLPCITISGA